jgi:hypothetical protein
LVAGAVVAAAVVLVVLFIGSWRFRWGLEVAVFPRRGVAEVVGAVAALVEATGGVVVDDDSGAMM